jgi:hypothetical protein
MDIENKSIAKKEVIENTNYIYLPKFTCAICLKQKNFFRENGIKPRICNDCNVETLKLCSCMLFNNQPIETNCKKCNYPNEKHCYYFIENDIYNVECPYCKHMMCKKEITTEYLLHTNCEKCKKNYIIC